MASVVDEKTRDQLLLRTFDHGTNLQLFFPPNSTPFNPNPHSSLQVFGDPTHSPKLQLRQGVSTLWFPVLPIPVLDSLPVIRLLPQDNCARNDPYYVSIPSPLDSLPPLLLFRLRKACRRHFRIGPCTIFFVGITPRTRRLFRRRQLPMIARFQISCALLSSKAPPFFFPCNFKITIMTSTDLISFSLKKRRPPKIKISSTRPFPLSKVFLEVALGLFYHPIFSPST